MTVQEIINFCLNRHNEGSANTSNWGNTELYALIEARSNQILATIGLYEAVDTSLTTTASTSEYTIPTDIVRIRRVRVNGQACKYLDFRRLEARRPLGVVATGTVREWSQWAGTLILDPAPSTSAQEIKIYCEKRQASITNGSSTVNVPAQFHYALCDGVIADMYAKDLNTGMMDRYEAKWDRHQQKMEIFYRRRKRIGAPMSVVDADSSDETENGII